MPAVSHVVVLTLIAALAGCQVQLISTYDSRTDIAATELQQKLESFLLLMADLSQRDGPEAVANRPFQANRDFYREVEVAVSSLNIRAEAIPNNDLTVKQITLLPDSIDELKKLHRQAGREGLRPVVVKPVLSGINAHLQSIITLELAKKRGEGP